MRKRKRELLNDSAFPFIKEGRWSLIQDEGHRMSFNLLSFAHNGGERSGGWMIIGDESSVIEGRNWTFCFKRTSAPNRAELLKVLDYFLCWNCLWNSNYGNYSKWNS